MSLSIVNSTIIPLNDGSTFNGNYDNILDFAEILISIHCDKGYTLSYIFSQDKINTDYSETKTITASQETLFFKVPVHERYFKLQITASDGDMEVLNVQTIYKTSTTYELNKNYATIWDNASVNAGDISPNFLNASSSNNQSVSIFGSSSQATTLSILLSNEPTNFKYTQYTYDINSDSDFGFSLVLPFRYLTLSTSNASIISAYGTFS